MAFLRDRSVFCIPQTILDYNERYIIGSICMVTSSVGFAGAVLQVKSLRQYRDRQRRSPSPNPQIIFYLALSDLIACIGVFALAISLMTLEPPAHVHDYIYKPMHNSIYAPLGTSIESDVLPITAPRQPCLNVITLFAYLASYIWTLSYSLDMCFQVYKIECSMTVYHILAWLIPLELVVIIEGVNFGQYPNICERYHGRFSRLILSYFPVMAVLLVNPFIFHITYRKVKQRVKSSGRYTVADRDALILCKKKFLWIVIAFTACWLPNIFSVTYDLITLKNHLIEKSTIDKLWFVEAFLNPLQGLFNYFVYRRSFKVTATDTRPSNDCLPSVTRVQSLGKLTVNKPSPRSNKRTVEKISDASSTEDSPLLNSLPPSRQSSRPYVYISKLLGE